MRHAYAKRASIIPKIATNVNFVLTSIAAGGWWLVAGGWWLVAGGWWLVMPQI
ncbi:hypothetical protein [Undibacterium sp. Ji49W]|uniref:hypothetical protein n=1 Tax=Undibacterium sp. Ji49W TaxID=3413040 RepID=UPI003BF2DA22